MRTVKLSGQTTRLFRVARHNYILSKLNRTWVVKMYSRMHDKHSRLAFMIRHSEMEPSATNNKKYQRCLFVRTVIVCKVSNETRVQICKIVKISGILAAVLEKLK